MKRSLVITLALAFSASFSRGGTESPFYVAAHSATLSGTADTVTVQQPASPTRGRAVQFVGALVQCSALCTITVSQNGAAATTTALTVTPINLSPNPTAVAFSASNVGAGTTVATYTISDANTKWIDLTRFTLPAGSNGSNLSLATNSITGTTYIAIYFNEQQF